MNALVFISSSTHAADNHLPSHWSPYTFANINTHNLHMFHCTTTSANQMSEPARRRNKLSLRRKRPAADESTTDACSSSSCTATLAAPAEVVEIEVSDDDTAAGNSTNTANTVPGSSTLSRQASAQMVADLLPPDYNEAAAFRAAIAQSLAQSSSSNGSSSCSNDAAAVATDKRKLCGQQLSEAEVLAALQQLARDTMQAQQHGVEDMRSAYQRHFEGTGVATYQSSGM
jgi:hypothetical protein